MPFLLKNLLAVFPVTMGESTIVALAASPVRSLPVFPAALTSHLKDARALNLLFPSWNAALLDCQIRGVLEALAGGVSSGPHPLPYFS